MIGILVELLLSYLLLKYFAKKGLNALGVSPDKERLRQLLVGLLLPILYTAGLQWTQAALVGNPFRINPHYSFGDFIRATGYVGRSVLYEELIFNGAILYILIQRIGSKKAIWLSAICFGLYHWFSWNLWGNPLQMAIVFLMTGTAGWLFALAFSKTRSLYLPFALHFGIDFAAMVLFSQDKAIGPQLLIKTFATDPRTPGAVVSLLYLIVYYTGFPVLCLIYLRKKFAQNQGTHATDIVNIDRF
jgi:membrane protease YdiL (CAAX protease family)